MLMKKKSDNNVVYLTGEKLSMEEGVVHAFSTRYGGVSKGYFSQMNLSYTRGDEKECVDENFRLFGEAVGFNPEKLVFTDQQHTANVRKVTEADAGKGIVSERDYDNVDGLVTDVPGIMLTVFSADCVPVLFYDPVKRCVGSAHSGWRGSAGRICKNTVEMMAAEYGSCMENIRVLIGPCICQDCYEVSEDVAEVFMKEFSENIHDLILKKGVKEGKYQLDLVEVCRQTLLECGVKEEHIELPGICTCHNPELLFSHRKMGNQRGNLCGVIGIR